MGSWNKKDEKEIADIPNNFFLHKSLLCLLLSFEVGNGSEVIMGNVQETGSKQQTRGKS